MTKHGFAEKYPAHGHAVDTSNQLALATLKENTALADSLAWALERMRADGSYEAIMTKWGVASVPSFAYAK